MPRRAPLLVLLTLLATPLVTAESIQHVVVTSLPNTTVFHGDGQERPVTSCVYSLGTLLFVERDDGRFEIRVDLRGGAVPDGDGTLPVSGPCADYKDATVMPVDLWAKAAAEKSNSAHADVAPTGCASGRIDFTLHEIVVGPAARTFASFSHEGRGCQGDGYRYVQFTMIPFGAPAV